MEKGRKMKQRSIRLTAEGESELKRLALVMGIPMTNVIELAIRELARKTREDPPPAKP